MYLFQDQKKNLQKNGDLFLKHCLIMEIVNTNVL